MRTYAHRGFEESVATITLPNPPSLHRSRSMWDMDLSTQQPAYSYDPRTCLA